MKLSPLQIARYQYNPKLPGMLRNGISEICVKVGNATESVADQEKIKALFPNTYGKPEITFQKGENTSAAKKQIVGVILSGGQAPGGHNVICGLYDALKATNKENELYGFKGGPSGLLEDSYVIFDVEAAGVAELVDIFVGEDDEIIVQQAAGTALEAIEFIFGICGLQRIVQAANNIVAAGSLSAGQDNAYYLLLSSRGVSALLESDLVFTVGIGEQGLDLLLICYAFGGVTVLHADLGNAVTQHTGQLGSILVSG